MPKTFYTVKRGQYWFTPMYRRGLTGQWRAYTYKGDVIVAMTYERAYELIRQKAGYNDALLAIAYID